MTAIGAANPKRTTKVGEFSLGDKCCDGQGREFIYIHALEALTENSTVMISSWGDCEMVDTGSTASAFGARVGVVLTDFVNGEFGWAQIYGPSIIKVGTNALANTALNSTSTPGRLDDNAAVGAEVISGIVTTSVENSNLADAILNYPTIGITL